MLEQPQNNTPSFPKRRFWVNLKQPPEALPMQMTVTDKFTVDHLAKVLRLRMGESVLALDDTRARGYIASIQSIEPKHGVTLTLERVVENPTQNQPNIILAAGLIKESHWEWLLQKATELGVSEIIPIKSQFSDIQDRMIKPERWLQIVKAAALQSERFSIPTLHALTDIQSLQECLPNTYHKLLLQERANNIPNFLSYVQTHNLLNRVPLVLVVGPEGGWHSDEVAILKNQGFQAVSLGSQIFRAETASIAGLSILLCQ